MTISTPTAYPDRRVRLFEGRYFPAPHVLTVSLVLMNYSDPSELLQLRPYLSIKHHVAGRIRVVFSAGLLEKVSRAETRRLPDLMSSIQGVREVRLNLAARSAVVSYDPAQIPPKVLVDLLEGDERAALQALKTLTTRSTLGKNRTRQEGKT